MLCVAVDGTPLLGRRTGIGRYTEHLINALVDRTDVAVSATAFSLRGMGGLPAAVPAGVRTRSLPIPARLLRSAWTRLEFPPVGLLSGRADVFHGTNFVLPPTGRAGGVVTIHDLAYLTMPDVVDHTNRALRELVPRSIRRAAAICTPTRAVADQIADIYGPGLPDVLVTPLGVDPEWLTVQQPDAETRRRLLLPDSYFLFVGTREPRKDLRTLLAAYDALRAERGAAARSLPSLLLVGSDGWGPGHQPAPGVQIHEYVTGADLRLIVAGARALVMPSRDEGFGLPALEGLAAGSAVIVSDVPAMVEVTGGRAAVFPIGDVDALAVALGRHADPPDSSADAGLRLQRREYAAGWTWQQCADRTMAAYRIAQR